jgi:hypothetical protein
MPWRMGSLCVRPTKRTQLRNVKMELIEGLVYAWNAARCIAPLPPFSGFLLLMSAPPRTSGSTARSAPWSVFEADENLLIVTFTACFQKIEFDLCACIGAGAPSSHLSANPNSAAFHKSSFRDIEGPDLKFRTHLKPIFSRYRARLDRTNEVLFQVRARLEPHVYSMSLTIAFSVHQLPTAKAVPRESGLPISHAGLRGEQVTAFMLISPRTRVNAHREPNFDFAIASYVHGKFPPRRHVACLAGPSLKMVRGVMVAFIFVAC